jgi:hypothetical protein
MATIERTDLINKQTNEQPSDKMNNCTTHCPLDEERVGATEKGYAKQDAIRAKIAAEREAALMRRKQQERLYRGTSNVVSLQKKVEVAKPVEVGVSASLGAAYYATLKSKPEKFVNPSTLSLDLTSLQSVCELVEDDSAW